MEYTLVFDGTTSSSSSLPSVNSWCILGSYNKEQTRRLLVQILVRNVHRLKFSTPSIAFRFNPLTSKIWLSVLLSVTHFHVNQLREFGVRSSNHFYLIILSILIYCLLDNLGMMKGEVTCSSLLRVNLFSPLPSLPLIALFYRLCGNSSTIIKTEEIWYGAMKPLARRFKSSRLKNFVFSFRFKVVLSIWEWLEIWRPQSVKIL